MYIHSLKKKRFGLNAYVFKYRNHPWEFHFGRRSGATTFLPFSKASGADSMPFPSSECTLKSIQA